MSEDSENKNDLSIKIDILDGSPRVFENMSTEDIIMLIKTVDGCKKNFVDYLLNSTNIFKRSDSHKIFKILNNDLRIEVISYIAVHSNIKYSVKYICEILSQYENNDEKKYIFTIFQDNMKYYKKMGWVTKVLLLLGEMHREKTLQILMFMFRKYKGGIDKDFLEHMCMLLDDEYYKDNMLHLVRSFRHINIDNREYFEHMREILQCKIKDENILHKIFSCLDMDKEIMLKYDDYKYDLSQMRTNDKLSFYKKNGISVQICRKDFDTFKVIIHDEKFGTLEKSFSENIVINGTNILS